MSFMRPGYTYDHAGRFIQQTYPSGAVLDTAYGRDGRPVEIKVNGATLISRLVKIYEKTGKRGCDNERPDPDTSQGMSWIRPLSFQCMADYGRS